jgi:hypothetical protein
MDPNPAPSGDGDLSRRSCKKFSVKGVVNGAKG